MALVPIRIDRTSKPPLGTPLRSDGHWSVQGLLVAYAFNELAGTIAYDSVRALPDRITGASLIPQGCGFTGTAGNKIETNAIVDTPNGITIIAEHKRTTLSVTEPFFNTKEVANWEQANGFSFALRYDGELIFRVGNVSVRTSGAATNDDRVRKYVAVWAPGLKQEICVDDKWQSYSTSGIASSCAASSYTAKTGTYYDMTGGTGPTSMSMAGILYYQLVYDIALSRYQIASLSANPWQIYEPEVMWIEIPDGAGGTAYTSSADAGTVTLTGSATTNYHAYVSSADTGSVTLTGSTTSDYRGLVSHADTGTVTITGNAATDYRGLVSHAGAGSVILAGSTSTDYRNLVSSADTSTVTLTGYAAMDTITGAGSYTSNAEAGSITLSGVTTTNYRTLISGAGTGAVTVTGFTATDTVTAAGAYTSEAAAGTILLTGLPVTSHRSSVADSSAIQIVGSDATGYFGFTSGAEPSAVIITGAETSVLRTWISDAIPGSIVIHGYETSGISPIYEISKIFATARLSGPSATGRITTPTTGIRLT